MNLTKVYIYKHSEAAQKQKALRRLFLKLLYVLVSWTLLNCSTAAVKALIPCLRAIQQLGYYFYLPQCKNHLVSNPLFKECEHVKRKKKMKQRNRKKSFETSCISFVDVIKKENKPMWKIQQGYFLAF